MTAIEHDVDSLGALYDEYGDRVRRLCQRRLRHAADAEDAAHEALLKAWSALPGFDRERPIWPWLATIAGNVCIDLQRRQATARSVWVPPSTPGSVQPEDAAIGRDTDEVVRQAFGQLPTSAATALFLRDVQGWDYEQIGGHLDRSPGAARTAVARARHQLRQHVEDVARARGQWPLSGLLGGVWLKVRQRGARLRAAAADLVGRVGRVDAATDAAAAGGLGTVAQAAFGALVVLGGLTSALTPAAPTPRATSVVASADPTPAAAPTARRGTAPVPPARSPVVVASPAAPVLPATPSIELPASVTTPLPDLAAVTPDEPSTVVAAPGPEGLQPVAGALEPVRDELEGLGAPLP
jgi:RNA polymerase sigma-70 factor (ECF subfamily)